MVPNPSFELYNPCSPNSVCMPISQAPYACISSCCNSALPESVYWINGGTYNWWAVYGYTPPGYINRCIFDMRPISMPFIHTTDAWFIPRSGNAFIMINTYGGGGMDADNLRQFAQVKLTSPMKAGCSYEMSCYALLSKNFGTFFPGNDREQTAADGLGMYVSADSVSMNNHANDPRERFLDYIPQVSNPAGRLLTDSTHYQKVSGIYVAQGGEQWLVIGNFKDNAHTQIDLNTQNGNSGRQSIYLIDDVSVMEWKPDLVSFTDSIICADSTLKIILPEGLKNYTWSTGETSRQISISVPGTYTVEASNGCTILRDTFRIQSVIRYAEPLEIGKDTFFCDIPATFHVDAPSNFDSFYWSTGSTSNTLAIQSPGTYWLDAIYSCGTLRDSIVISEFVYPDIVLLPASDTVICSNAFLDIRIQDVNRYATFLWNNGSTEDHLHINTVGEYSIHVISKEGCHVKDTFLVDMKYPPKISLHSDTTLCIGTTYAAFVKVNGMFTTVEWQDGTQGLSHSINTSGLYSVQVSNECYTVSGTTQVTFLDCTLNIPNLITVNNDGKNDFFEIVTAVNRPLHLIVYTSWGAVVYDEADYKNDWNGKELGAGIYFYSIRDSLSDELHKGWLQIIK